MTSNEIDKQLDQLSSNQTWLRKESKALIKLVKAAQTSKSKVPLDKLKAKVAELRSRNQFDLRTLTSVIR